MESWEVEALVNWSLKSGAAEAWGKAESCHLARTGFPNRR